jgi:hypothetical protein
MYSYKYLALWSSTNDGVWRRLYNKELYSLFNDVDIIKIINISRLRWVGHVVRRENEEIMKK